MEKINITKILIDCPQGMELDCTCADNVVFDKIIEYEQIKCVIGECRDTLILDKYGRLLHICCPKCVIFPKGKTNWEGFTPSCQFKDGDIVFYDNCVSIFKEWGDETLFRNYVKVDIDGRHTMLCDRTHSNGKDIKREARFATEEEKAKLFKTIKDNGYCWNSETKTLEKLPKFKVGDKIRCKADPIFVFTITNITKDKYECGKSFVLRFTNQDDYELVPNKFDTNTLKPFDKVLVRMDNKHVWSIQFFERLNNTLKDSFVCMGRKRYHQCIPYKGNEHLVNTVNDCEDYFKTWQKS